MKSLITKIQKRLASGKFPRNRGFALLIAAITASAVLIIGSAIFTIAQKQVILASLAQQSQYAFYAADTGAECALYWDDRFGYFGPITPISGGTSDLDGNLPSNNGNASNQIYCDQTTGASPQPQKVTVSNTASPPSFPFTSSNQPSSPYNYTLQFTLQLSNGYCTYVTVQKCQGTLSSYGICTSGSGSSIATQVRANGYNVACTAVSSSNIALQRTVVLNY